MSRLDPTIWNRSSAFDARTLASLIAIISRLCRTPPHPSPLNWTNWISVLKNVKNSSTYWLRVSLLAVRISSKNGKTTAECPSGRRGSKQVSRTYPQKEENQNVRSKRATEGTSSGDKSRNSSIHERLNWGCHQGSRRGVFASLGPILKEMQMTPEKIRAANTPYVDPTLSRGISVRRRSQSRTRRNCVRWTLPAKPLALTWTRINAPRFVLIHNYPTGSPVASAPSAMTSSTLGSGELKPQTPKIQRVERFCIRAQGLPRSRNSRSTVGVIG